MNKRLKVGSKIVLVGVNQDQQIKYGLNVGDIGKVVHSSKEMDYISFSNNGNLWMSTSLNFVPHYSTIKEAVKAKQEIYIKTDNNDTYLCDYFESLGLSPWVEHTRQDDAMPAYFKITETGEYLTSTGDVSQIQKLTPSDYSKELQAFIKSRKEADDLANSFTSTAAIWKRLLEGGKVKGSYTGSIYSLKNNELYIDKRVVTCVFDNFECYTKHFPKIITPWYENIGKGRWCKVWGDGNNNMDYTLILRKNQFGGYVANNGVNWDNATPLTTEEVLKYCGEE